MKEEKCLACYGTGLQRNKRTGLKAFCPVCGGTGKKPNGRPMWRVTGKPVVWEG